MFSEFDIIVVGAGHAGNEAAAAAANMGSKVLLVTMDMTKIGQMSCNPAMGGVAKGQIVREIDALGGLSGIVSDKTAIQFRMLNRSKGPAMWSPRTQNDRARFAEEWRMQLEAIPNLYFWQDSVVELLVKDKRVYGVITSMGQQFHAKAVVLTNGTFLNGIIHIGEKQLKGGRAGEKASYGLTAQLEALGFESGRMKTGTPPRLDGRSLNYAAMTEQEGDPDPSRFSYMHTPPLENQMSCYITYTSQEVHDVLKTGFEKSPMFNGRIQGLGPRYCPSIEDKINRFSDKDSHQLFVEPEGRNTVEIYVNGFSSSLPEEVQYKALRKIVGFENAVMFRPGYAIEYDYFPPVQLRHTLETKLVENLYFAGQINGTTGYEEAACQGLMAGINAHLKGKEEQPLVLGREEAYIGVLIDDLINKGTEEPYRMFTSRAEYRILLRQDNADFRLTEKGRAVGLVKDDRYAVFTERKAMVERLRKNIVQYSVSPEQLNAYLESKGSMPLRQKVKLDSVLSRPNVFLEEIMGLDTIATDLAEGLERPLYKDETELAETLIKYEGYIQREREMAEKMQRLEYVKLDSAFDYHGLPSLSMEAREKLSRIRPENLGQASRISGVSPADISVLLIKLGR
ncbi:MAG: tRNA uridine-5-carboxymethylaminomethyl(34) synthesis enzyme MnmG [Flavobacteriales bacterium]